MALLRRNPHRVCRVPDKSPKESTEKPKKGFNFMELPPEIRQMVYPHLLLGKDKIMICSVNINGVEYVKPKVSMQKNDIHLAILVCNPTIYREASEILYKANTFSMMSSFNSIPEDNWRCHQVWLDMIGPKNRSFLTNLQIQQDQPTGSRQNRTTIPRGIYEEMGFITPSVILYPIAEELLHAHRATREIIDDIYSFVESAFHVPNQGSLPVTEHNKKKLTITVDLRCRSFPRVSIQRCQVSLNLPNLKELLGQHIMGEKKVEVIWQAIVLNNCRPEALEHLMSAKGWETLLVVQSAAEDKIGYTGYKLRKEIGA